MADAYRACIPFESLDPPLAASRRHACDRRAVLDTFRALDEPDAPSAAVVARAATRHG